MTNEVYIARAQQMGTNESMKAGGRTKEQAINRLRGQPFGPIHGTITVEPMKGTRYVKGCPYCERELSEGNTFFPSHTASPRCESGGYPHCTCDSCF